MKASHAAVATLTALASAGVVALAVATFRPPTGPPPHRQATGSRRPVVVGQARSARPVTMPPNAATPPDLAAAEPDVRGLDEYPTIAELDNDHPGLAEAYRAADDTMMASTLARDMRRCFRAAAHDHPLIEWEGLRTFTVDASGQARLAGQELIPSTPGIQPFLDCISHDVLGKLAFKAPEGTPATFSVREGGGRLIRGSSTPAQLATEVAALTRRLESRSLSPAQRSVLEQQLALWRCYADRGPAFHEQCQRELDGE